jgi:hypothetical protein
VGHFETKSDACHCASIGLILLQELTLWRSASKVARRWRATAWVSRHALVALVAGLAVINAGVYAQLVAAHVGDGPR